MRRLWGDDGFAVVVDREWRTRTEHRLAVAPSRPEMSPFTYADRIKAPILLIHGGADDNSGTFPIQSERMYAALKGNGATVRYVVLPNEPHGYRALESTEETLWQMTDWLDRYVKPKQTGSTVAAIAAKK
jgi:pimeloyl-ACP methyl ester carboxylesterase